MSCTSCNQNDVNKIYSNNQSWQFGVATAGFRISSPDTPGLITQCGFTGNNYVVIGDTVASLLYAARLVNSGIPGNQIYVLTEGPSNLNYLPDITSVTYAQEPGNEIALNKSVPTLAYPHPSPVVDANNQVFRPPGTPDAIWNYIQTRQLNTNGTNGTAGISPGRTYYTGKGTFGDFAAAYIVPRAGPWFVGTNKFLQARFYATTQTFSLNCAEVAIYSDLRTKFKLQSTCLNIIPGINSNQNSVSSIMLNKPPNTNFPYCGTSQGYQMIFVEPDPNISPDWCPPNNTSVVYTRQLYHNVERSLRTAGVQFVTNMVGGSLRITNTNQNLNISVMGVLDNTNTSVSIQNANIIWMVNSYDYARLTSISGYSILLPTTILTPLTYRVVLSIPLVNGCGVDLTNLVSQNRGLGVVGDGVTTYVSFSLKPNSASTTSGTNTPSWFVQAYTTNTDQYPISPSTANAEVPINLASTPNSTLLVIEAVDTQYYRTVGFDGTNVTLTFAEPANEANSLSDFLIIAANILNTYTGQDFSNVNEVAEFFFGTKSSGSTNSVPITVAAPVQTNLTREMTITTVLQTGAWLYGHNSYPCPWNPAGTCPSNGCQNNATTGALLRDLITP
jgi:hypothetical protein